MPVLKNQKRNIVLIGMPGAGKSTVGVVLAKNLGLRFVDSDICIQEIEKKLLHEIIKEKGTQGFLEVENRVNASLNMTDSVIATGGSAVYGKEAMQHLRETGIVVYLKLSCDAIKERLGDLTKRGVALKTGQTLEDLYEERSPLYEKYADLVIDCENQEIRKIVAQIASHVTTEDER